MTSDIDSNGVLTREEREEHIIDLYFNQNKKYSEIAKIARISPSHSVIRETKEMKSIYQRQQHIITQLDVRINNDSFHST
jgi:DNA-directed RNA polymerase specialized sigma subunit